MSVSNDLHDPANDDATVLYRPPGVPRAPAADDDATVLAVATPAGGTAYVAPAVASALQPGFRLHEYRIDEILGQGGFGITYLATDVHLNARVAIKEYLPAGVAQRANDCSVMPRWEEDHTVYQSGLDSFLVEARTLATFRHPNIVRVARFFEAHRTAYMVLEYERGKPLRLWWRKRRTMSENDLLDLLKPLLDGLGVVHAAGFLHRDIKPGNIMVRKDDGSLVLIDFGAARATIGPASVVGTVVTPGYAPPEQYDDGAQGPWTDIYALGATLYWMVAGVRPPAAPERASGAEVMRPAVEVGAGRYSGFFLSAIDWALQLDPASRPQTLDDFIGMMYASHTGSVALSDRLKGGDVELFGSESVHVLMETPNIVKRRALQLGRALLRPDSWPMAVKLTVAMVVAALVPMLITAWYNYDGSVRAISATELLNLERIAQSTAGHIGQLIKDSEDVANFVSTDPGLAGYLASPDDERGAQIQARLRALTAANPDIDLAFLMNTDGLALVSTDPAVLASNYGFREYFQQARAGHPYKTGILVGSKTHARGTFFSYPVYDGQQHVAGVLAMRVKASAFSQMLRDAGAGTARTAFLIDEDGVVIEHPDAQVLHHSLARLSDETQTRIAADQRFDTAFVESLDMPALAKAMVHARQAGSISYRSTITNSEEHVGYAPVPHHDWVVGVTEPRASVEAPLARLFANVQASVLLVGLVFLVLAVLAARSIVRPVARLTEAANALKDGDYERASIEVTSNDEIGRLARTFNVMIDVLRQREREREQVSQRGRGRGRS